MTEPRLIKRGGKSGYNTRRSASESNSRSPIYFPEVDVDVRPARPRGDEPDFSHIKSSDDISSGYSSADNSASLTRTASLGAAARARARASRTTVTTIKRPQAAEESEVIIEELQEDDSFDYANMPPLVNVPSPIFLSHSDPPFIYQYIGDQVKILQVLGNHPCGTNISNEVKDTTFLEQTRTVNELSQTNIKDDVECIKPEPIENKLLTKQNINQENDVKENTENNVIKSDDTDKSLENEPLLIDTKAFETTLESKLNEVLQKSDNFTDVDTISLETSTTNNDTYSSESDDEASFGTPEDSPKAKRKSPKGKYGKAKAPPPPKLDLRKDAGQDGIKLESKVNTSQESLNDIINQMPNIIENNIRGGLQVVNPIAEKKRRHKSKSPGRVPKSHSSGLGKLLQLPNKLAFWHKGDDKIKSDNVKSETVSNSSEDLSRRSSTVEKQIDEFQSCFDLNTAEDIKISNFDKSVWEYDVDDDQSSFKDAADFDNEVISNDIIEKSDALQKLIEAKIESHPEYKYVSLHEELPTTSKSTDV